MNATKPPLGLTPEYIWQEQHRWKRIGEILGALQRHYEAATFIGKNIPEQWTEELNRLVKELESARQG